MQFSSMLWGIPFCCIILAMSTFPLFAAEFWHKNSAKVIFSIIIAYLSAIAYVFGIQHVSRAIFEPILFHYISFVTLIVSLYITASGIYIGFSKNHGALFNFMFLLFGSILSGFIGTTGAAVLLIRPLLRANYYRKYKTHVAVFFIFLVANIGGAATPLGDPPLFIGFLEGVNFFWFIQHLYPYWLGAILILSLIFFAVDSYLYKIDNTQHIEPHKTDQPNFELKGKRNVALLIVILAAVIGCNWKTEFIFCGDKYQYASLIRNILLIIVTTISIKITPQYIREKNGFTLEPVKEVVELFLGIFITVMPLIEILHLGSAGSLKCVFDWLAPTGQYLANRCFWVSGILSSVLDNAPTFLIFFHLTSGDAAILMTEKANILKAISISTVFMGALTYIGNAPNLMIRSIAKDFHVKMPSFIGYLAWSIGILIPLFIIISYFL